MSGFRDDHSLVTANTLIVGLVSDCVVSVFRAFTYAEYFGETFFAIGSKMCEVGLARGSPATHTRVSLLLYVTRTVAR